MDAVGSLRTSLDRLTQESANNSLHTAKRRKLEIEIKKVIDELTSLLASLDPIAQPTSVFDPSNPKVVGRFVALAMVAQDRHPLSEIPKFYGSGVYAIYYKGALPLYLPISGTETPIYIGKAAPAIGNARAPIEQGAKLSGRLSDHRKNIGKARSTLEPILKSSWEISIGCG